MKKFCCLIIMFFLSMMLVFAEEANILPSQIGIVENVVYTDLDNEIVQAKQVVDVRLLKGNLKGQHVQIDNILSDNPYYDIKLKKGMKVLLHVEEANDELVFSIEDIKRSDVLLWLTLLFCGLVVYVGGRKGLNSLISIIITCILILNLLSPLILWGINPILATILICLLSTAVTMFLVGGVNRKSASATLGCVFSLIIAGVLSLITVKVASLTGFVNEHSMFLYSAHPELNFIAIGISSIILATMGAVMDVAMSIASTINEIYTIDNTKTVNELFASGMNVGRDIIGTMANTLILVYLGGSLPLVLLASNIDLQKFINLNQVVTEIASALIGSCAIVICVPITAIIASEMLKRMPAKVSFFSDED